MNLDQKPAGPSPRLLRTIGLALLCLGIGLLVVYAPSYLSQHPKLIWLIPVVILAACAYCIVSPGRDGKRTAAERRKEQEFEAARCETLRRQGLFKLWRR